MANDFSVEQLNQLQVECIETFKVYDFCFQQERRENNCFDLNRTEVPAGSSINCQITNTSCEEVERGTPDDEGRTNVTFAIMVEANVQIQDPDGDTIFNETETFGFTKTVVLCAPEGTQTTCNIVNATCGPCMVMGNQVCCTFDLCVIIQSLAVVKLLVPSFGFCTPNVCEQVAPGPPLVCPPQLFPPQCPDDFNNNNNNNNNNG